MKRSTKKCTRHPQQVCPVDGTKFRSKRKGTVYCSKSCRQKAAYQEKLRKTAAPGANIDRQAQKGVSGHQETDFPTETRSVTRSFLRVGKAVSALVPYSEEPVEGWPEMVLDYETATGPKHVHMWAPKDSDMWALGNAVAEHMGFGEPGGAAERRSGSFEIC